jgi:hypothetical protein
MIGMLAKPVRIRGSNFKMLPNPTEDKWQGDLGLLLDWAAGMEAFQLLLAEHIAAVDSSPTGPNELTLAVSEQWKKMRPFWKNSLNEIDIDMREAIHDGLDMTISPLENIAMRETIENVVVTHLLEVVRASDEIRHSLLVPGSNVNSFVQYYFNIIRVKVANGEVKVSEGERDKRNAIWIALMFRMICWFLLHDFDKADVNIIPSELKGSRIPVAIG